MCYVIALLSIQAECFWYIKVLKKLFVFGTLFLFQMIELLFVYEQLAINKHLIFSMGSTEKCIWGIKSFQINL